MWLRSNFVFAVSRFLPLLFLLDMSTIAFSAGSPLLDFRVFPEEVNRIEGAFARFMCSTHVAGPAENLTLRWIRPEDQLDSSSYSIFQSMQNNTRVQERRKIWTSPDGRTFVMDAILQIRDITPADAGMYICRASFENQTEDLTVWLHIIDDGHPLKDKGISSLWWMVVSVLGVPLVVEAAIFFKTRRKKSHPVLDDYLPETRVYYKSETSQASIASTNRYVYEKTERDNSIPHVTLNLKADVEPIQQKVLPETMKQNTHNGKENPCNTVVLQYKKERQKRLWDSCKIAITGSDSGYSSETLVSSSSSFLSDREARGTVSEEHESSKSDARQERFKHLETDACKRLFKMPPSKRLQTNLVSQSYASGFFDENGGHLSIPEANVHMFIPPQAIKAGCQQRVYMYLEKSPRCDDQNMLGPVLHCGPPGLKFDTQVIFSLPLRTSKSANQWRIIPMRTETEFDKPTNWKPISESENALCFIDGNTCTFFVDHFTGHGVSCKDDQVYLIGAFSSPSEHTRGQFNFHIICWKSDLHQTRLIHSAEEGQHSHHLDTAAIHIYPNRADLHLDIEEVIPGWSQVTPTCSRVVVPYDRLMSESVSKEQTEFEFKINSGDQLQAQRFACRIMAYQLPHQQEGAELHVFSQDSPEVLQEQIREEQLLPPRVFNNICVSLDNESIRLTQGPNAKGWQSFAEQLGLPPAFIANLSKIKSNEERRAGATPLGASSSAEVAATTTRQVKGPTATILAWWELQNKRQGLQALQTLHRTFHRLGRPDVCRLLDPVIERQRQGLGEQHGVHTTERSTYDHARIRNGSVQETNSMQTRNTENTQEANREDTTLAAAYVGSEATQISSWDLYETDGTTSGIDSSTSSPQTPRFDRFSSRYGSYVSSFGSYDCSN